MHLSLVAFGGRFYLSTYLSLITAGILEIPAAIPSAGQTASLHCCLLSIIISFFLFPTTHSLVLSEFCMFVLIEDIASAYMYDEL